MKLIIPFIMLFITSFFGVAFSANDISSASSTEGVLIFIGLIGFVVLISAIVTRCPACGKWWARVSHGKKELQRKGSYKTITRRDSQYNSKGEQVGHVERQEQVHIITVYYENYYSCKHCNHEWTKTTTDEYEG
jgi:hypothetical protein